MRAGIGCGLIFGVPLAVIGTLADHGWRPSALFSWSFLGLLVFLGLLASLAGIAWEIFSLRVGRARDQRSGRPGA